MRKITLLLTAIFLFNSATPAEAGIGTKVIGTTIKTVVKIVVATTNLEKTKKKIIDKIENIDEKKFRERYTELHELIGDLPPDIKDTYKVTPHMTKEQMIENVRTVDKKEIYRIINRIPDKTVARLFKVYLSEMGKGSKKEEAR